MFQMYFITRLHNKPKRNGANSFQAFNNFMLISYNCNCNKF